MMLVSEYANRILGFFGAKDKRGVTAIEYGLIAGLIAVVIILAVKSVGSNLSEIFNDVATALNS